MFLAISNTIFLFILQHHYNIREIDVNVGCFCNGHASECIDETQDGSYKCICQGNTCGAKCQECCPAFNQRKWKPGTLGPFEFDPAADCEGQNLKKI